MRHLCVIFSLIFVLAGCGASKKETPAPAPAEQPAKPATGSPNPAPQPAPPSDLKLSVELDGRPVLLAFGDSLTEGLRVDEPGKYPTLLQKELDALGYKYQVVNGGVSGDTTAMGLARIDRWLQLTKPAVVILELGANDGLRGMSTVQMQKNLAEMIKRIQAAGAQVVLAGVKMTPNLGQDYLNMHAKVYVDLAAEFNVPLFWFADPKEFKADLVQPDGIHPKADGYKLIVEQNVVPALVKVLKK